MESDTRKEIEGRTLKLDSYETEKALIEKAELRLLKLYAQTHEVRAGRRVKLTNRRKLAKAKALLDSIFDGEIDVNGDAINQLKVMTE